MTKLEKTKLEELQKAIVIERLRQAPPSVKVSFGSTNGDFMSRDELIREIEKNSEIGQRIVKIHIEYLKAFKKGLLLKE